jgi:hypothetical protein
MPTKATKPEPLSAPGVWSQENNWYLYKNQKYWHKDIEAIADLRRAGIHANTIQLKGPALEDFVKRCLDTEDYRVLGLSLEPHDYEFLKKLESNQQVSP